MPVSIPFTFVGGVGNKAKASEVNANFQALAAKFTEGSGGISDGDIYSFADINAHKLSSSPGKRLIASKFEPGAVDATALKSDATAGSPAAAVGTSNHIKDAIVTKNKLKIRYEEQFLSWNLIAPGIIKDMTTSFPNTTDFFVGCYLEYPTSLVPSGVTNTSITRRWLLRSHDIVHINPTTSWVWVQIVNTHASVTIDVGVGAKLVFVFLQN